MTFLDLSAEEFFSNFEEYKPFGESSYPCLNPASDHFGEPLIKDSVVLIGFNKVERSRDLPLGVFSCNCGFIYQRFGPDKCEEDKFKYNSVREYGTVWENKLSKSWQNSNYTIKKIAEELRTTSSMVVRHAIRLGLTEKFPNARQIEGYADHRNPRKTFSELLSKHRKEWLSVLMNNPEATRQNLIDKARSQYAWLRRNDSDWLEENLPPVYKSPRKRGHLNWEKIDLELCRKIEQIVLEIRKEENPIARVSITEIIRRVGKKIWIEKREEKLPLTAKLIDENLENFEDFMIRKIQHTKKLYLEEKRLPTRLQFCVRAVIRNKVSVESERVQKEIDDSIEILKKLNQH